MVSRWVPPFRMCQTLLRFCNHTFSRKENHLINAEKGGRTTGLELLLFSILIYSTSLLAVKHWLPMSKKRLRDNDARELPPNVLKRLAKEYADVLAGKHGVTYVGIEPVATEDLSCWRGFVEGPKGSPYEGGLFQVSLSVSPSYPFKAPGLVFETKIYHCESLTGATAVLAKTFIHRFLSCR
jgi:hypothetical protein